MYERGKMSTIKWIVNNLIFGFFMIVMLCAAHDVGNVRAGGKELVLPKFAKAVFNLVLGDDDEPEEKPETISLEETDDAGLLSEFAKRRFLQWSNSEGD